MKRRRVSTGRQFVFSDHSFEYLNCLGYLKMVLLSFILRWSKHVKRQQNYSRVTGYLYFLVPYLYSWFPIWLWPPSLSSNSPQTILTTNPNPHYQRRKIDLCGYHRPNYFDRLVPEKGLFSKIWKRG